MPNHDDQPSLRSSMLIIAAGTISTSLAQPDLLDLPIRHLLKDELRVSESQMAMLFGIGALAWYAKPLAGILIDSIALFGSHRRWYLIISACFAAALWLLMGAVSRSYPLLLLAAIALQSMLVIGSTVLGGFLVEQSKLLRAEGRLVSCRMFVEHACVLIAGPVAGYLAGLPFAAASLIGAAIAVAIAPVAAVWVTEPIQGQSRILGFKYIVPDLRLTGHSRAMWLVAAFSLLSSVPQSFATPLYFYQKNSLALSDVEIGFLAASAGIGGILASIFYQYLCRKLPMRWLLVLGASGACLGITAYLFYVSLAAAFVVEFVAGFLFALCTLALMQGAVIATLAPSAAFGFALLMSASNAGGAIGDNLAALLVEHLSMTLFDVIKLFAAIAAACCLFVFLLPRSVLDHCESKPLH